MYNCYKNNNNYEIKFNIVHRICLLNTNLEKIKILYIVIWLPKCEFPLNLITKMILFLSCSSCSNEYCLVEYIFFWKIEQIIKAVMLLHTHQNFVFILQHDDDHYQPSVLDFFKKKFLLFLWIVSSVTIESNQILLEW